MGDSRRYDLALLFSLGAVPIAGCAVGLDDQGTSTSWTTVASTTQGDSGGGEETGGDDTGGSSITTPGPNDGGGDPTSAATTMTTDPGDGSMTDPTNASVTNPTMTDPTYGGSYGSSYGGSYGSYGGSYGTGGGMIPEVCYGFASNVSDCDAMADYGYLLDYCAGDLAYGMMVGAQCGSALEEFYACMSSADCQQILMGDPCNGQGLSQVCGGA